MKPWKSVAYWPSSIKCSNSQNASEDYHDTKGAAQAVCKLLMRHGYGGEGKVFPVKTEVIPNDARALWRLAGEAKND